MEIRQIKNICVEAQGSRSDGGGFDFAFVSIDLGSVKGQAAECLDKTKQAALYVIKNEVVFFMSLNEVEKEAGGFGTDVQKLYAILVQVVDAICEALSPQDSVEKDSMQWVNQDTIRDNFSSITLLIDAVFDGVGVPGGAVPNLLIGSRCTNQMATEMLKKGTQHYGTAQDMLQSST